MPFQVKIRDDLSLMDLKKIHRAGFPVYKTPHIGNWYPNNLAVASMGIPMKVCDHTRGCKDKNFHPDCLIMDGKREQIANPGTLTTHAVVTKMPERMQDRFPLGAKTSVSHIQAVRDAIPQANLIPQSEYLAMNAENIVKISEIVTKISPHLWDRFVHSDGATQKMTPRNWSHIVGHGIHGLDQSQKSGWRIPLVCNILFDGLLDPYLFGSDKVYHLSGPDMYRYIGKMQADLDKLYDAVRKELAWNVPETIEFNLVPVANMRFAVPMSRKAALKELTDTWETCARLHDTCDNVMRVTPAEFRKGAIPGISALRANTNDILRAALENCPDPLYDIYDGNFFSQYDLLQSGEELFVSGWGKLTSMREIDRAVKAMFSIQKTMARMAS